MGDRGELLNRRGFGLRLPHFWKGPGVQVSVPSPFLWPCGGGLRLWLRGGGRSGQRCHLCSDVSVKVTRGSWESAVCFTGAEPVFSCSLGSVCHLESLFCGVTAVLVESGRVDTQPRMRQDTGGRPGHNGICCLKPGRCSDGCEDSAMGHTCPGAFRGSVV